MNSQEILLSFSAPSTGAYYIAYLMCNELFDAIEFGNRVTQGTVDSDFIVVASTQVYVFNIDSLGPISLTFNPSALNLPNKISHITYTFDDGTPDVNFSFFYSPTSVETMNLPYSAEPGDPRNYTYTKKFYSTDYFTKTYTVNCLVYQFGVVDPIDIIYNVNIISPQMDGVPNGYFEEMHLISSRMFGPNDDILYTFETVNPNYVLPVLMNWNNVSITPVEQTNVSFKPNRPYKILQPYEIEDLKTNSNIKIIDKVISTNLNGDQGQIATYRILNDQPISSLYPYLSGVLKTQNGKYLRLGYYFNNNTR